jgi:hypothetical protein
MFSDWEDLKTYPVLLIPEDKESIQSYLDYLEGDNTIEGATIAGILNQLLEGMKAHA